MLYIIKSGFFLFIIISVPNFLLVKNTADTVYPTGIQFSIQNMCVTDLEDFEKEIQDVFKKLLDHGFFDEAYSLAKLHSLSESNITVQKVFLNTAGIPYQGKLVYLTFYSRESDVEVMGFL